MFCATFFWEVMTLPLLVSMASVKLTPPSGFSAGHVAQAQSFRSAHNLATVIDSRMDLWLQLSQWESYLDYFFRLMRKIGLFSLKILVTPVLPGVIFAKKGKALLRMKTTQGWRQTWWYTLCPWILTYLKSNLP